MRRRTFLAGVPLLTGGCLRLSDNDGSGTAAPTTDPATDGPATDRRTATEAPETDAPETTAAPETDAPETTAAPDVEAPSPSGLWPQFGRDPANRGYKPGESPTESLEAAWSVDLHRGDSRIRAAPAVADETVFATVDGTHALDATTGGERWYQSRGGANTPGLDADASTVFTADYWGYGAFGTDLGNERWDVSLSPEGAGGLTVGDGSVYVALGSGSVVAVRADADTHEVRWETSVENATAAPAVADGRVFVVARDERDGSDGGTVTALTADTGETLWSASTSRPISGAPTVADSKVFVGDYGGVVYALNAQTGAQLWRGDLGDGGITSSLAYRVRDGTVYAPPGDSIVAYDADTGGERWISDGVGQTIHSNLAVTDVGVYYTTGEQLWVTDVDTGDRLAVYRMTGDLSAGERPGSPAVVDNYVFVGRGGTLYAVVEA